MFLFYLSGAEKTRSHYFFVAYPTIIILAVGFLINVTAGFRKIISYLVFALILVIPLLFFSACFIYFYAKRYKNTVVRLVNNVSKITKQTFYNGKDLKVVFEKKGGNLPIKFDQTSNIQPRSIYTISYDPGVKFTALERARLVKTFDNKLRQGPIINIYETE